jgi:hypothetical protein
MSQQVARQTQASEPFVSQQHRWYQCNPRPLVSRTSSRQGFAQRPRPCIRLSGGRTWWAHFEFTRINIEPIILRKKIEDLRIVDAFLDGRERPASGSRWRLLFSRISAPPFCFFPRRRSFSAAVPPSLVDEEDSHENDSCRDAEAHGETDLIAAEQAVRK